jgi:hypothetical protein
MDKLFAHPSTNPSASELNEIKKLIGDNILILECPHCGINVGISSTDNNCGIYRCGIKADLTQISPHASKIECDTYINQGLLFGCAKPYKTTISNNKVILVRCEYI